MARQAVEALIGKAMLDDVFREHFLKDPQAAAQEEGYYISDDERDAIVEAKEELEKAGNDLSEMLQGPGAAAFVDIHIGRG